MAGLTLWVKDHGSSVSMSSGVGPALLWLLCRLWLWCRPDQELPYAAGVAVKRKKKNHLTRIHSYTSYIRFFNVDLNAEYLN